MTRDFRWRHFRGGIIPRAVRWHCRHGVGCRDLGEMPEARGVAVDHTTIHRWVQAYAPEIERCLRWHCRLRSFSRSWRVDETCINVKGQMGVSASRGRQPREHHRFLPVPDPQCQRRQAAPGKALRGCKSRDKPGVINTDKAGCHGQAIRELKKEGKCPVETDHRQVKCLDNIVEADHGRPERPIRPTPGFRSMKTACATMKGFEAMRALRKKQDSAFRLRPGIRGEVRPVGRAFGIGPEMTSGFMSLHGAEPEQVAIRQGS